MILQKKIKNVCCLCFTNESHVSIKTPGEEFALLVCSSQNGKKEKGESKKICKTCQNRIGTLNNWPFEELIDLTRALVKLNFIPVVKQDQKQFILDFALYDFRISALPIMRVQIADTGICYEIAIKGREETFQIFSTSKIEDIKQLLLDFFFEA